MKAEEILKETFLKYRGKKKGSYTLIDVEIEAMQDYARLQIEKDRDRIKDNVKVRVADRLSDITSTGNMDFALHYLEDKIVRVDLKSIDETPIELD